MKLSKKQSIIVNALREKKEISLEECVRLIGANLYCNANKHVGATLSNMVNRGVIDRVKPGVFRLKTIEQSPLNFTLKEESK